MNATAARAAPGLRDPSPAQAPPLLQVRDLRLSLPGPRGPVEALRGLDFTIRRGETLGLIGESGCGKSLTALALMGLLPLGAQLSGSMRLHMASAQDPRMAPPAGPTGPDMPGGAGQGGAGQGGAGHGTTRELVGLPEADWCRLRGDRIAMVFQEPMTALNPLHRIGRQIAEPLRLHRGLSAAAAQAEALRLLERVQLPRAAERLQAYPHELSGGQRQRVVIAIALACGPDLLIADEPTTALDVAVQREVLALIAELVAQSHMALLFISHDLAVVAQTVQRLMVMYAGEVVEAGATREVFARLGHPYTRALMAARPRLGARVNMPGPSQGAGQGPGLGQGVSQGVSPAERPGVGPHPADAPVRTRRPRLPTIPGLVPELGALPPGCAFAARCGLAIEACRQARPPLAALPSMAGSGAVADEGHQARCVRALELAGEGRHG